MSGCYVWDCGYYHNYCKVPWAGRQLQRLSCGSAGLGWNEWTERAEDELKTGIFGPESTSAAGTAHMDSQ
jgi:hypothetical protein